MKTGKWIALASASLLAAAITWCATHPQRIIVAGKSVAGLTVQITTGATWQSAATDATGTAIFGHGPWHMPWKEHTMIVAVKENDTILWEGPISPGFIEDVEIPAVRHRTLPKP